MIFLSFSYLVVTDTVMPVRVKREKGKKQDFIDGGK